MPIEPIAEFEDTEHLKPTDPPSPETLLVSFGYMRNVGEFRYSESITPHWGTKVVVRTRRGVEIGTTLGSTDMGCGCAMKCPKQTLKTYVDRSGGKQYPFDNDGRVMRIATWEDINEQNHLESNRPRYLKAAREKVDELDLPMDLIEVEPLLGGERLIFYFMAEGRVDFRELVRRLAGEYHTRIEMRQVGARDEARLVADYEKCGQHCCCRQFLKHLKPISMKAAKIQKATLDTTKISGRCGRLMCCLRYEQSNYDELRKKLPRRGRIMLSPEGPGEVIGTQIITQLVRLSLEDGNKIAVFPVDELQHYDPNQPLPKPADKPQDQPPPKPSPPTESMAQETSDGQSKAQSKDSPSAESSENKSKRRRRRRSRGGRKRRGGDGNNDSSGSASR